MTKVPHSPYWYSSHFIGILLTGESCSKHCAQHNLSCNPQDISRTKIMEIIKSIYGTKCSNRTKMWPYDPSYDDGTKECSIDVPEETEENKKNEKHKSVCNATVPAGIKRICMCDLSSKSRV